jgi:hypothetical protein
MKTKNKFKKTILAAFLIFTASAVITGCDENGGILIPSGATDLTLSIGANDNITDNPADAVIITEAKALITEIEYERERDGIDQLHHTGPYVVYFNLTGSLTGVLTGFIVRDIYTKAKFKFHKPESTETPADPEFKDGTGDAQRYSFIIKGTYNGAAFVYKSKKSAALVINFNSSANINLKEQNLTVLFNKTGWFKNGTTVLNPNLPANADIIDNNIRNSFMRAFKDDNKDGQPD